MYSIRPIRAGVIDSSVTKGGLTYLTDESMPFPIPIISFLITADDPGDDYVAVVDTGIDDPPEGGTVAGREVEEGGGPAPLREALTEEGYEPADVDHVILTHLHYDHACNNDLFPDAEFLLQRDEWEAAQNPLPVMRRVYFDEHVEELREMDLTLLDGGYRLRKGLELLPAPGHTAGMQAVVVETRTMPHAIISDLAYCRHNLEPGASEILNGRGESVEVTPSDLEYIPPGLLVSVADCYMSMGRIQERVGKDGVLLGGHVTEILGTTYPED